MTRVDRKTEDAYRIRIDDMSCASCVARVERAILGVQGVQAVSVNLVEGTADVDGGDPAAVVDAVTHSGYPAWFRKHERAVAFAVEFDNVVPQTSEWPALLAQLDDAPVVTPRTRRAVELTTRAHPADVLEHLQAQGFSAHLRELRNDDAGDNAARDAREIGRAWRRALLAGGVGFSLMLGMWTGALPMFDSSPAHRLLWAGFATLCLVTMMYSGAPYYLGAWKQARHGTSNMDTLVALGTGAAWLSSVLLLIRPDLIPGDKHLYLDTSVMILAFLQFGHALEIRAKGKTRDAIGGLYALTPETARCVRPARDLDLPIGLLRVGDEVRVRPGERVPIDGEVIEGRSHVDESMLTGESLPASKQPGDMLTGGTLNGSGALVMRVTQSSADTTLAHIIQMVKQAQSSKPPIGRLVDRVAAVFVPVVLLIAALTFVVWLASGPAPRGAYALTAAIAVLVIACPCALGLATPIAIMVGIGRAAQAGILIRNGDALQTVDGITHLVVDKTGTLTEGRPRVTRVQAGAVDETRLLQIAASLEVHSEHPLADAIVAAARERDLTLKPVVDFVAHNGLGVSGRIDNRPCFAGNRRFMLDNGVVCTEDGDERADHATLIYVARDTALLGTLQLEDPIRRDSAHAVRDLHAAGIQVVMCTGDRAEAALAVARQLGIEQVYSEVLPAHKADVVEKLQRQGHRVAMAGDGINDAPALARADVGFAIGSGTAIAIENADITLASNSLTSIRTAIALSRATLRNIRQNLFGAFIYNVIGIPLAAGVFYPLTGWLLNPVFASAAMAMSSVTVVTNANRLRFMRLT